jgi:hypothetical protein
MTYQTQDIPERYSSYYFENAKNKTLILKNQHAVPNKYVPPMPSHPTFSDYNQRLSLSRHLAKLSPSRQHDLNLVLLELRERRISEKLQ